MSKKNISLRMNVNLIEKVKEISNKKEISFTRAIEDILTDFFSNDNDSQINVFSNQVLSEIEILKEDIKQVYHILHTNDNSVADNSIIEKVK